MKILSLLDVLIPRRRMKRELETLRRQIEAKIAEVAAREVVCRQAWGKKRSYVQMQRRKQEAEGNGTPGKSGMDGVAEVLEMRRQQDLADLKTSEQELETLQARERPLATKLGETPTSPEVHGEEH